jgi:hypothetical protein
VEGEWSIAENKTKEAVDRRNEVEIGGESMSK